MKRIIGLPAIVSARHRIVIDKSLRALYGIDENSVVLLKQEPDFLRIQVRKPVVNVEKKSISIGRFNLPSEWARRNHVHIGDRVTLLATDSEIIVCPQRTDFLCLGKGC